MIQNKTKISTENRLIFRGGPESFGSEVRRVEQNVQTEIQAQTPDAKVADIVDEDAINNKIAATEQAIDKSPIRGKHKEGIRAELKTLLDARVNELRTANTQDQDDLLRIYADTVKGLEDFNKNPKIAEIYNNLEPFFVNQEQIAPVINLETYRKNGKYSETISAHLADMEIDKKMIQGVQKILGIEEDGDFGPNTINAVSEMLGLGIKVEYGEETKFVGEEQSVEAKIKANKEAYEAKDKSPEAYQSQLDQLPGEIEKINAAEKLLSAAADKYMKNLMGNGKSAGIHEEDFVDYLEAYNNVLSSATGTVKIVETFIDSPISPEQRTQFTNIMATKRTLNMASINSDSQTLVNMPTTVEDLRLMQKLGENTALMEKRRLFTERGNLNFEQDYEQSQDAIKDQLNQEVNAGVDGATEEDKKLGLDAAKVDGLKKSVSDTSTKIVNEFDAIQRMQPGNPVEAYKRAQKFTENLQMLSAGNGSNFDVDMVPLAASPNLRIMLTRIADNFVQQSKAIMEEITHNNSEIVKYQEDFNEYQQRSELFIKSATRLFEQLQQGVEIPSEHFMAVMHEGAEEMLNSPIRKRMQQSSAPQIINALNDLNNLKNAENPINDFMNGTSKMAHTILKIEGSASTFASFAKHLGKDLAVIGAAVAGAVALGLAAAATGGVALAGAPVMSGILSAGITAVSAGLGGTVGAVYGQAAVDGNMDSIVKEGFEKKFIGTWAKNSAYAFAFMGAGKILQLGGSKLMPALAKLKPSGGSAASAEASAGEAVIAKAAERSAIDSAKHAAKHFGSHARKDFVEDVIKHKIDHSLHPTHEAPAVAENTADDQKPPEGKRKAA